jgi:hemoglobin
VTVGPSGDGHAPRGLKDRVDVEILVQAFYTRAFADPLLGPIFRDVAQVDLEAHLPVMCDFWETVLFRAGLCRRNALQVHADLHAAFPLSSEHFGRWLTLWTSTVDDLYEGEKAELAKAQAARIAYLISRRLLGESGSEFVTLDRRERQPDINPSKTDSDPLKTYRRGG